MLPFTAARGCLVVVTGAGFDVAKMAPSENGGPVAQGKGMRRAGPCLTTVEVFLVLRQGGDRARTRAAPAA